MNVDRWHQITTIFHRAREYDPADREAFLADACRDDPTLRREVEAMLDAHVEAEYLGEPLRFSSTSAPGSLALSDSGRLWTGARIGPYEIVGPLGAGGMGEVYRAHDTRLGREVAIKTLPQSFVEDTDRLTRFRHEARVLASLNHPNIAAIHGLEKSAGVDHLILELVEGEILAGPVPVERALAYAGQIAEALEAAHAKGIVHRDLKPANVKVTPQGRVKLLDFGVAKAVRGTDERLDLSRRRTSETEPETLVGQIVGSPSYMSPEQARGQHVDERADIWSFGCLLYELLTGMRAFPGASLSGTIEAVLNREPDWTMLPDDTPSRIRQLLRRCLEKDVARRLPRIADGRRTIEQARRPWNRWQIAAAVAALVPLAVGGAVWSAGSTRVSEPAEWTQITALPDSVTQPALSPDGSQVTFIRGPSTFFGPGQVYVKTLPDGEPRRLTDDSFSKMSPVFSHDGKHIAYTVVGSNFKWDTWLVPVEGGEPRRWLQNASGLIWNGPGRVLFSTIKGVPHMGVVAADESGGATRDVYIPAHEHAMAHRTYPSPDGNWLLIVEMDMHHAWLPCRLTPVDGSSPGRQVGPSGGGCTFGAWSPDGRWMYVTSNAGGVHHVWRQRFPDGQPEQVTSGPTEEQGIAMAPDGLSFVTAMALQNQSIWLHDGEGERQISTLEGIAANPKFTADGKKLCYTIVREAPTPFSPQPGELWVADVESGRSQVLTPGMPVFDYDVSPDGGTVVLQAADAEGRDRLWLMPLDRRSPARPIPGVEGNQPKFGANGEIFFRKSERNSNFIYRMAVDGSGLRQVIVDPVPLLHAVSPDGNWIVGWTRLPDDGMALQAFSSSGGDIVRIADFMGLMWSPRGSSLVVTGGPVPANRSYIIPLSAGEQLPPIPDEGFLSEHDIANVPGARRVDALTVPGPTPEIYAFYRGTTQRNLYRVPVQP